MMKCLNCSVEQGSLIFCLQIGAVWIQVFIPTEILKTPAVGLENCQSWIVRVVFKKLASPCPEELCIYSFFFPSFLIKTACLHFCLASKWSHFVIQPCLFVMCPFSLVFIPLFQESSQKTSYSSSYKDREGCQGSNKGYYNQACLSDLWCLLCRADRSD